MKKYFLNTEQPKMMHIDLNSAFASAEQQAWPHLRGKPLGVTNRLSPNCCVIAASYEAKALGINTGMRRKEALALHPGFIILETDPTKYTWMYNNLLGIMKSYSPNVRMLSIDEGLIDFHGIPGASPARLLEIGMEIKSRMKAAVGQHIRLNVGVGPNRFLAKMAAKLHKPDGLDLIDHRNLVKMYRQLELEDLTGIAEAFGSRLRAHGINNPIEFLEADPDFLRRGVFRSIMGLHWHRRLRGYEVDDFETRLRMIGRQWIVAKPTNNEDYLRSCLHYLTETAGKKLRYRNVQARGVCVWLGFSVGGGWYDKTMYKAPFYTDRDIWEKAFRIFNRRPRHMVVNSMGVYMYELIPNTGVQANMFEDAKKADDLSKALDEINDFYGSFTMFSADTLKGSQTVKQKIPFGGTEYFDLLLKRA